MTKRPFPRRSRPSGLRDSKLIVIASEGTKTEKRYFEDMVSPDYYRNPKVHVEVLTRYSTASSPRHVIRDLDKFKKEYSLNDQDELWLVIDRDKWGLEELSSVASQCVQKGYHLAVSTPCFELWLLLHLRSLDEYTKDDLESLCENKRINSRRTLLDKELADILGSYNKSNVDTSKFLGAIESAITRAKALDIDPSQRWPESLGSRVYLLVESIINIKR